MYKTKRVDGGWLTIVGCYIRAKWDDGAIESWTAPSDEEAARNFDAMVERWTE